MNYLAIGLILVGFGILAGFHLKTDSAKSISVRSGNTLKALEGVSYEYLVMCDGSITSETFPTIKQILFSQINAPEGKTSEDVFSVTFYGGGSVRVSFNK